VHGAPPEFFRGDALVGDGRPTSGPVTEHRAGILHQEMNSRLMAGDILSAGVTFPF